MLIDKETGELCINSDLIIKPYYKFSEFKKTPYFHGQDGIKIICLDNAQKIDGNEYIVNLFFKNMVIYSISLIINDKSIVEQQEAKRKEIHDQILKENGIQNSQMFSWGKIISEYDMRSNISEIGIYYYI